MFNHCTSPLALFESARLFCLLESLGSYFKCIPVQLNKIFETRATRIPDEATLRGWSWDSGDPRRSSQRILWQAEWSVHHCKCRYYIKRVLPRVWSWWEIPNYVKSKSKETGKDWAKLPLSSFYEFANLIQLKYVTFFLRPQMHLWIMRWDSLEFFISTI